MTALVKIQNLLNKMGNVENSIGETVANAIKARKKADLKVIGIGQFATIVATDEGDTLRIVSKADKGFAAFASFLKRKSSVFFPKMELVLDTEYFQVYKTERLIELDSAVGVMDANAYSNWIGCYASARSEGRAKRGAADANAPESIKAVANIGNLRGCIAKMVPVAEAAGVEMDLCVENFMIRANADGSQQIVVNDPYHPGKNI